MFLFYGRKTSRWGDRNGPWPRVYIEKGEPNPRGCDTSFASAPPQSVASCVFLVCFRCAISGVILAVFGTSMVLAGKIPFQGLNASETKLLGSSGSKMPHRPGPFLSVRRGESSILIANLAFRDT